MSWRPAAQVTEVLPLNRRGGKGLLVSALRFLQRKPLGAGGAAVILLMVLMAAVAGVVSPYDPYETHFADNFRPPSAQYWLGTDQLGRDIFSRILHGARIALLIGLSASFIGSTAGALLGILSAYFGRGVDLSVQRVIDVLASFPLLILALTVVTLLGRSIPNIIIAIAIPIIPLSARVVRSNALAVKEFVYVDAARAIGASHLRIMARHILPNVVAPYLIILTAQLGQAILTEASLSFLGLGTPEPKPSWGLMLSNVSTLYGSAAPWMAVFPGIAISLAVFGFNLFGDALRDVLDPRLRGR